MQKVVVINIKNCLFADAVEKVLRENTSKDYVIARAETARELEQYICLASVFLLEVTNRPDYTMEDRLELRERVKATPHK